MQALVVAADKDEAAQKARAGESLGEFDITQPESWELIEFRATEIGQEVLPEEWLRKMSKDFGEHEPEPDKHEKENKALKKVIQRIDALSTLYQSRRLTDILLAGYSDMGAWLQEGFSKLDEILHNAKNEKLIPKQLESKRRRFTPETFRAEFKVGDFLSGWSTGKIIQITAIGQTRFFAKTHNGREEACAMHHAQGWTKELRPHWWAE